MKNYTPSNITHPTIYVSPDRVEIAMMYLTFPEYRGLLNMNKETRKRLEEIADQYDSGVIKDVAIVKSADFIGTDKTYDLNHTDVKMYTLSGEKLPFGLYDGKELAEKMGKDRLESMIFSDFHLIE